MLEELKAMLDTAEKHLAKSSGHLVVASESGPVSIHLVKAVINEIERQQGEIESLKKQMVEMQNAKG